MTAQNMRAVPPGQGALFDLPSPSSCPPPGRLSRSAFYVWYMNSRRWADVKATRLAKDGWKCTDCGTGQHLQVHHVTYARLGEERLADLATLCQRCHARIHRPDARLRAA